MKILILSGQGINCEEESRYALSYVYKNEFNENAQIKIQHVNEFISKNNLDINLLVIPGGFSFADALGAGVFFTDKLSALKNKIVDFLNKKNTFLLGICNGCQVITRLFFNQEIILINNQNKNNSYICKWVKVKSSNELFKNVSLLPIAHGEGRFTINQKQKSKTYKVILNYNEIENNFNNSELNIAGISSVEDNILAMMPHPERALFNYQLPQNNQKPFFEHSDGYNLFKNIINKLS